MESRTLQVLEFPKILGVLADFSVSEPGARACLSLRPADTLDQARQRCALTNQAHAWVGETGYSLKPFPELDGLFSYLDRPNGVVDQDGLFALKTVLSEADKARNALNQCEERGWDGLFELVFGKNWPQRTMSGIGRCLDPEGRIRDESSPDLLAVRQEIRSIHQRCTKRVKEFVLREDLGNALQDEFMTISSDRYVLPLKSNFKGRIKGIIHDYSQTGETCYFEPMFLVETNNRLQELKREEREEEYKVLTYLTELVRQEREGVQGAYDCLVALDALCARVKLALEFDGRTITISDNDAPSLKNARHPLLALGNDVVPFDIELREGQQALIISGGNAGGKTVCLKTLGLISLMAFSGLPVPAEEGSSLPFWPEIFVVMGDEQSLEENVSTFTAQIQYLRRVWDNVNNDTLFILDEFGAGTDPTQGAALAQGVVDSLVERGAISVVATHFPALKAYAMAAEKVRAASVLFDPATKKPLYRLAYDQVGASIALDVAREHGLPVEILERAEKYLLLDGSDTSSVLDRLNALAVERESQLQELAGEKARMERKRASLEKRFEQERKSVLNEIQGQAQAIVKQWQADKIGRKEARRKLAEKRDAVETMTGKPQTRTEGLDWKDIVPGRKVAYLAWNKTGTVLEVNDRKKQAKVDVNGVAMWVKAEHLGLCAKSGGSKSGRQSAGGVQHQPTVMLELDLRGQRADEALSELERALDNAIMRGAAGLEIVHGRGTGALRREVHEFLKHYPAVDRFELAPEDRGGDGMTEVFLR